MKNFGGKKSESKRAKLERIRQKFMLKAQKEMLEENLVKETIAVAQAMNWTLEYVLNMGIDAYFYVVDFLNEQAKEMEKERFRPPATLR